MITFGDVDLTIDLDLDGELADLVEPYWREELSPAAEQLAKNGAAVDSGELRAKTFAEVVEIEGVPAMIVGSEADHFLFVEYGTRHMEAQPFARPAGLGSVAQLLGIG